MRLEERNGVLYSIAETVDDGAEIGGREQAIGTRELVEEQLAKARAAVALWEARLAVFSQ